ncbi:MAG: DUF547 domain-containing protein [Bacteroidota bacterium]
MHYTKALNIIFCSLVLSTTALVAQPSHAIWNRLLQENVTEKGQVDYAAIQKNSASLDSYLNTLSKNPPTESWSKNAQLAYWINTYNAFTVKLIIDNYPVKSITDLHNGKPWDVQWIEIGDKTYSLNTIENKIIRPTFKEPRIHFAVNCAAKSCPPLLNRAWTAKNLDYHLDRQTRSFINNAKYNKIEAGKAQVSKIFDWYSEDFGEIAMYLNRYLSDQILKPGSVTFLAYDWGLNEQ